MHVVVDALDQHTCMLKSFMPAATSSLFRLLINASVGMDSSCSSGYSRVSIAMNTGCCNSSLQQSAGLTRLFSMVASSCSFFASSCSFKHGYLVTPNKVVTKVSYIFCRTSNVGLAICSAVSGRSISLRQGNSSWLLSIGKEKPDMMRIDLLETNGRCQLLPALQELGLHMLTCTDKARCSNNFSDRAGEVALNPLYSDISRPWRRL